VSARKIPTRLLLGVAAGVVLSKLLDILTNGILQLLGLLPPFTEPNFNVRDHTLLLCFHSVYAILSAFVAALIAKEHSGRAISALGVKEAIFWLIGTALLWNHSPFWVNMAKAVLGPPLCWIGGELYRLFKKGRHLY
jgi:hypothetical protein